MKKIIQTISKAIEKKSEFPRYYAQKIGLREATLYEFLSGKGNPSFSTLLKIIDPLGLTIDEELPGKFVEVDCVFIKKGKFKKGGEYKGKYIAGVFGTGESSHQALLLEIDKGKFEMLMV